jgi:hypothetical protein
MNKKTHIWNTDFFFTTTTCSTLLHLTSSSLRYDGLCSMMKHVVVVNKKPIY